MSDFELIKEKLNLLQVITQETGLAMKGPHLEACPFCGGHNCFCIAQDRQLYHCKQCNKGGDLFKFVQEKENINPAESLKYIAEKYNFTLTALKKEFSLLNLTIGQAIFIEAAKYYHGHMFENGGKEYLIQQRGHNEEILKSMQIGWTDGGLVDHLRSMNYTDEQIKASGLAKEWKNGSATSIRDFFGKGLAVFPHFSRGHVLHFTQKDPEPDHEKKRKYQLPNTARVKDWRFYNQDALSKFSEVIAVEGENDLLSIMDISVKNVIAFIGQPAEYQIKTLQTFCRHKLLYLWLDNDNGGRNFIRSIAKTIKENIRIISHPSGEESTASYVKDADDYLRAFAGDKKKEIKRLQDEALDYISWEIWQIGQLSTIEKRLNALKERKIFAFLPQMVLAEKQIYIEKLVQLGFTKEAIEEQIEFNQDLRRELAIYYQQLPKGAKDADPNTIADIIFRHFLQNGICYHDAAANTYVIYQHKTYQMSDNTPFKGLIKRITGPGPTTLLFTKEPGRSVFESLRCEAYNSGKQLDRVTWINTDRKTDTIYVNLNTRNKNILKIAKNSIEDIPNGMNDDGVLLGESNLMLPINFLPDTDIREGMQALKELIFDWMACEKEQRYYILCWFISAFLLDFAPYMALTKFSGAYESGKSTPMKLLSIIMYGEEHLFDATTAGAYSASATNPLIILDDLESEDITKSLSKFLRLSATKGEKLKRTTGSERATTSEKPAGLIGFTAIDPLLQTSIISRTFDIEFSYKHQKSNFIEDDVKREILQKRDLIISSILKLISEEVLPNLKDRKDYIAILRRNHAKHSKRRMDEYISLLMLILNKVINYIPLYVETDFLYGVENGEADIRQFWIEYQNNRAKENETSSNSIIKLLDGLIREYMAKMKNVPISSHTDYIEIIDGKEFPMDVHVFTHPDYLLEIIKTPTEILFDEETKEKYTRTYIEFTATSSDIVSAIDKLCKNTGVVNPFGNNVAIFGQRLKNDRPLLAKAGWEMVTNPKKPEIEPYYKRLAEARYYRLRKVIIR